MKKMIVILISCFFSLSLTACLTSSGNLKESRGEPDGSEDMVKIPSGWFKMGLDSAELNERPEHDVFVDTYKIDIYEVSAKDFAAFLNAKGNPDDKYFSHDDYSTVIGVADLSGKETEARDNPQRYVPRKGFEDYPANNVSWFGADEYCRWKDKHLPTEAQWEKAARGEDGRVYPWGNSTPVDTRARYSQKWKEEGIRVMVPVNALPEGASPYGMLNMAGNVWEWVNDWYRQNYCNFCYSDIEDEMDVVSKLIGIQGTELRQEKKGQPQVPPRKNPKGPRLGAFKVMRGGSWYDSYGAYVIRIPYRYWFDPMDRYLNFGFRCAR